MLHKPVLVQEVLQALKIEPGDLVVDGTLGSAGHSTQILKLLGPSGRLISIDRDPASIERCKGLFGGDPRVSLYNGNFGNFKAIMDSLNISKVDAILIDIGFSSDQVESSERGFSFDREGPLDMRMNPEDPVSARDLVNDLSEKELEEIFSEYGEERRAARFAKAICHERRLRPLETTGDLVRVLEKNLPAAFSAEKGHRPSWARRHPATRVFQALRIAVNGELSALKSGLPEMFDSLKPGGRLGVISFHSLEDRIVKYQFKEWIQAGKALSHSKKPVVAQEEERLSNRRSRSAKLRALEKLS